MPEGRVHTVERGLDGTATEYHDMAVEGDGVERLLTELFTEHWAKLTVGPLIEGAAYEIQFASAPKVTTLDGYLTVDTGAWHFHLCVNDHRETRSEELARIRRVARAAFFRTEGGSCAGTWGLRLWNGRGGIAPPSLASRPSSRLNQYPARSYLITVPLGGTA